MEGEMPVKIKCPKCGFAATWTSTGAASGTISIEGGPYAQCPPITAPLDRGEHGNVSELSCPDFYAATSRVVMEYRQTA
jgi:hypothetical protein